jgi:hypothetical protein
LTISEMLHFRRVIIAAVLMTMSYFCIISLFSLETVAKGCRFALLCYALHYSHFYDSLPSGFIFRP